VQSATAGTYGLNIAAGDLSTGPAGSNADTASASLTVTAAAAATMGGGGGGGGEIDWWDILFVIGLVLACRRTRTRG
jgi:hypothetical protein